jgi:hypothetical protein
MRLGLRLPRFLLAGGVVLMVMISSALSPAYAGAQGTPSVFAPVMNALRQVAIPVALPATLPSGLIPRGLHVYASIAADSLSETTYIVNLGFTPDCQGSTACRYGEVTGGWTADTPGVLAPDQGGVPIALQGGVHGTFYPFTCGASCGDSVILWHLHGIPYTVSIKAGARHAVLLLADAALANVRTAP